jgi:hypothetical protein
MGSMGALASSAQAASYPHITAAQAKSALPSSTLLPGGVKRIGAVRSAAKSYAELCAGKPTKVTLPGGAINVVDYGTSVQADSPKYLQYEIGVVTFATTAQAKAGAAKMAKVDKACPKVVKKTDSGVPEVITRTLFTKAVSKSWTGYRTIDHVTATAGSVTIGARAYETFFLRGNVVVLIDQIGAVTPTNGPSSDAQRKAVTNLVLARLTALK